MVTAPPHQHLWGPCLTKWFGTVRKRQCQVPGCPATISC